MKSNLLLLLTAVIWGFAFVAQRAGMEYIGPFAFNAIRFALGSVSLIPLLIINRSRNNQSENLFHFKNKYFIKGGLILGVVLFLGSTFQQTGLVYTSAGKSGFITGLYIILVPIFGLFIGQKTSLFTWLGAMTAVIGLYLLSVTEDLSMNIGDILVLTSAVFWAVQILIIGFLSTRTDAIQLAFYQFVICSFLSFIAASITEITTLSRILEALIPILYAGICSVGIAYTLQIIAQRKAHPANAAIIMSLEAVFAVIGGWLILSESIPLRGLIGCAFMLTGMILSQINFEKKTEIRSS